MDDLRTINENALKERVVIDIDFILLCYVVFSKPLDYF